MQHRQYSQSQASASRWHGLLETLGNVIGGLNKSDIDDLSDDFKDGLSAMHNNATRTARILLKRFKEKYPDDPLFCSVSLFGAMDLGLRETAHTRALVWLMDKNRNDEHGFVGRLAQAFVQTATGHKGFRVKKVRSELVIRDAEERGRADIWVEGSRKGMDRCLTIAVEAKINASEAEDQLGRYEEQLNEEKKHGRDVDCVFLTPDGRPAQSSSSFLWKPLSFFQLAKCFADTARGQTGSRDGRNYLRMYVAGVLREIVGMPHEPSSWNPFDLIDYLPNRRVP